MGNPVEFPAAFGGMYQDEPRNNLPKNKAWNMIDYLPNVLGAPATQRGGWGNAISLSSASVTAVEALSMVPFSAGPQLCAIDSGGNLVTWAWAFTTPPPAYHSAVTSIGSVGVPLQEPVRLQQILFIPSPDGSTSGYYFKGGGAGSITSLTAGPAATYAAMYSNCVAAAGETAQPQRVYFSAIGDLTTWNKTVSYIDVSGNVTGFAALPKALLVFTVDHCIRIRGSTPPPGTDMVVDDPIFQYGCTDARSIAVNGQYAAFANPQGVFLTNGTVAPVDLTLVCGIKQYWRTFMSKYVNNLWTLAGGWYGNYYVLAVSGTDRLYNAYSDAFVFDIHTSSVYRLSNMPVAMLAHAAVRVPTGTPGSLTDEGTEELYMGLSNSGVIQRASTMWSPGATYKNDGDGTAVTPVLETPFYEAKKTTSSQRWRSAYVDYDLRDAATDNPTFTLAYVTSPESSSYTTVSQSTLAETTTRTFARRWLRIHSRGIGLKLTRANASSSAKVYNLAADTYNREGSRLDSTV